MYEVPNQLHSDRLILSHSPLIILRKPTKKLPKGLRCERPFGLPWHHRRPTIKRQWPEVDSFICSPPAMRKPPNSKALTNVHRASYRVARLATPNSGLHPGVFALTDLS